MSSTAGAASIPTAALRWSTRPPTRRAATSLAASPADRDVQRIMPAGERLLPAGAANRRTLVAVRSVPLFHLLAPAPGWGGRATVFLGPGCGRCRRLGRFPGWWGRRPA